MWATDCCGSHSVPAPGGGCGTPPNYCSRTDVAVASGITANGGNPPAALIGLNGAGHSAIDDLNSSSTQAYLYRVTDYALSAAQLPHSYYLLSTPSSSTTRDWNSDTSIFATTDTGGYLDFFGFTPGSPPRTTFKGRVAFDTANRTLGGIELSTTNPLLFYSAGGIGNGRATLNSDLQDGSGSWTQAHITGTVLLDPFNCPGLTAYMTQTLGPNWNRYVASNAADISTAAGATPVVAVNYRYAQDAGSLIVTYDPTKSAPGCRWLDLKSGQVGGSYGPTGPSTGFGPLPPPAAPSVLLTNDPAGTLPCQHSYAVQTTYTVIGFSSYGGESTPSSITVVPGLGGGPDSICRLTIIPPIANPGGGTGINLTDKATGFNIYACDRTVNASCGPVLQTNSSNASGALAQPTITSVTGCNTGATSYTFYLVAKNAGGASPPSAGFTVNSVSNTAPLRCMLNYSAVPNATSYDGLVDGLVTIGGTSTTTSLAVNIGLGPTRGYVVQTVPIATTPAVTSSLNTTTPVPPTVNTAGVNIHNLRMDSSGQWIQMTTANAFAASQHSPVNAPLGFLWNISGLAIIPCNPRTHPPPYLQNCQAHWTHHSGTEYTQVSATIIATTLNSSAATMNSTQQVWNSANSGVDPEGTGGHLSGSYEAGPVFQNTYVASGSVAYQLPAQPYDGEIKGYPTNGNAPFRFCHNWSSAQQGFYSTPRGNVSQDGKWFVFTSDMQRNNNNAQGTSAVGLGSTAGGTSCTLGGSGNCRYDVFICQLK